MNIDINNFKDFNIPDLNKNNNQSKTTITNNTLERTPSEDKISFSKENHSDRKYKKIALAATLVGAGATMFAVFRGAKLDKLTKILQENSEKLTKSQNEVEDLTQKLNKNKDEITKLTDKITKSNEDLAQKTSALEASNAELNKIKSLLKNVNISDPQGKKLVDQEYGKIAEELKISKLDYDPLNPPKVVDIRNRLKYCKKVFKASEIMPFKKQTDAGEIVDVELLKNKFSQKGILELELPTTQKVKVAISDTAYIKNKEIENLGEYTNTDFLLNYGKNIAWSNKKIARDILQNFYDGHGNTLDGVKIKLEKLPNNETKIVISGKGIFDHENLQFLGSGTKKENPYNAGGFGEGAKVLVTNLLGSNKATSAKFTCADWQLDFRGKNGILQRKVSKLDTPINGNTFEFTTKDKGVVDSLIDAINFFKHSKNPDFKTTTFSCDEFSFDILPVGSKGNAYLTQRFEFCEDGAWEQALDGLNISFNRKPNLEKFKEITGKDFSQVRDRTSLSNNDIEFLTRYFSHENMSDDDLIKAILSTKEHWSELNPHNETAMRSFLKGLLKEAGNRNIGVEFDNKKIAYFSTGTNDVVQRKLHEYGYTIVPDEFSNIGVKSAVEIFEELGVHNPLQPTEKEIKKLKLLEKAVGCIHGNIKEELNKTLLNPQIKLTQDLSKDRFGFRNLISRYTNDCEISEILGHKNDVWGLDINNLDKQTIEKLKNRLEILLSDDMKKLTGDSADLTAINDFAQMLTRESIFDTKTVEQGKKIKNFCLITDEDITKPRYIFNRHLETKTNTLGEAIIESVGFCENKYLGHWVDREYLEKADFNDALATWIHEICHKSGGDGDANFSYTLTDIIKVLLATDNKANAIRLEAIKKLYEEIYKGG